MTVKERILVIRLSGKIVHHPDYTNKLGLSVNEHCKEKTTDKSGDTLKKLSS